MYLISEIFYRLKNTGKSEAGSQGLFVPEGVSFAGVFRIYMLNTLYGYRVARQVPLRETLLVSVRSPRLSSVPEKPELVNP